MPLIIGTLNVRGLGARRKQCQLKRLMIEKELDVLCVQETKIEAEDKTNSMVNTFGNSFYACVSHAVGTSGGCCILIRSASGVLVKNVRSGESGRLVVCDFLFDGDEFRVLCIYAPNKIHEREEFFQDIETYLNCEKHVMLLGDFNCVCAREDRIGGFGQKDRSAEFLYEMLEGHEMEDVAHIASKENCLRFTHFQGASHARLDRAYVSLNLVSMCSNYSVKDVSFSDHCLVSFVVGGRKEDKKFSWELWKLNCRLLKDSGFKEKVEKIFVEHESAVGPSWAEKWELIKQDVKLCAISRSTALRRIERAAEKKLRNNLHQLLVLESEMPGLFGEDIAAIKGKLEAIDKVRYQGATVRARGERLLAGETPTKRALGDERKYAQKK